MLRKLKTWILFLLFFTMCDCSRIMFVPDTNNPCSFNRNPIDCAEWKEKFPKEYMHYQKRMQDHEKSGRLKKFVEKYQIKD